MSGSNAKGIKPGILFATIIGYSVLVFYAYRIVTDASQL